MKECPVCRRCFSDEINHCPQDGEETSPSLLGDPTLDGRYLLERRLGQGGMGVVFQARHIFLKTSHAIKVILPDLVGNDPMLATRFRQEALAAAAIRHQNIIAVTDFGMVRGTMPFLVMEFVSGRSLQDILGVEGAMKPERALELITPIAAGVGAAHRQAIVHRDLKPLNIMVQDQVPLSEGIKILDFGLAKIKSGELLGSFIQAQTSGLMGSPFYMAPEQWSDEEPDSRADIYSLGVILYQMLAGDVPFKGSSIPSIMKKHLTLPPPSFQSMGVSVPPQLEAVVRHSLEKEVSDRVDSVDSFLNELKRAMNSSPVVMRTARPTGSLDPNKTMVSDTPVSSDTQAGGFSSTAAQFPTSEETFLSTSFDSMAGTVSSADLDEDVQKKLEDTAAAHRREKEEQAAREAQLRRKAQEEADEKRRQQEERLKREQGEREAREREQQEKLERMAQQAKELEDRLERLAVSMSPNEQTSLPGQPGFQNPSSYPGRSFGLPPTVLTEAEPSRKAPILLIISAVVVLVLAGAGTGAYFIFKPKPTPPVVTTPPKDKPPEDKPPPPPVKAELVKIDGGTFQMGRSSGPPPERPTHPVNVPSFFMDKTEVTNSEYSEFVRDTGHAAPDYWSGNKPPFGQELWPVVNVSLDDAKQFAAWRSQRDGAPYRLPTEEEWEYAARNGARSDLYPWGKSWQDGIAILKEATPSPVGSREGGNNRWGVSDLIGNVWEWTSSKVSVYPGNNTVIPRETKDLVTIRGGCYVSDPTKPETPITSAMREFIPATTKTPLLGFRLVRSGN